MASRGDQATLWVGSLAPSLTVNDIRKFFSAYGDVKSVRLGPQLAGADQYAFVTFASLGDASAALAELDGEEWEGVSGTRPLKIEFSRTASRTGSAVEGRAPGVSGSAVEVDWDVEVTSEEVKAASRHLWVGNLRAHPSQATLERVAARFGRLQGVRVFEGKLYGFVDYTNPQSAAKALKALQGKALPALSGTNTLVVEYRKDEGSKNDKSAGRRLGPSPVPSQHPEPAAAEAAARSPGRREAAAVGAAADQPATSTALVEPLALAEPATPQMGEEWPPMQGSHEQHQQPVLQQPQQAGAVSPGEDEDLGLPPHLLLLQQHAASASAATLAGEQGSADGQAAQQPASPQLYQSHLPPPPPYSHQQPQHIPYEQEQQQQQRPSSGPPPPLSPPLLHCDGCGASEASPGVVLRTCTGCQAVAYCGPECQMAAWQRGHHADCPSLAPLLRALQGQPQLAPTLWAILDDSRGREARLMRQVLTALAAEQRAGML